MFLECWKLPGQEAQAQTTSNFSTEKARDVNFRQISNYGKNLKFFLEALIVKTSQGTTFF